ncbi:MAG TPA: hypothetical protein VK196_20160, partial [Magnetospirillum sp.]|nr:hypothetical protein [Magnetospirillum sp.]
MYADKSSDGHSSTAGLAQSMGGLYLAVAALLLVVFAVLAVQSVVMRSRVEQTPAPAPTAAAPQEQALPPAERAALYKKLAEMGAELSAEAAERNRLAQRLEELLAVRAELSLQAEKTEGAAADARTSLIAAIQETERQLAAVSQALEVTEQRIAASQLQVNGLGVRLNRALLAKVEELQRSRSDFFARLRTVLADRPGFRIEGDRFTLASEVLFAPGSDAL